MYSDFIHLKAHTSYSLSEGAIKVNELVDLCVKNKMPAVGITDSGNLFCSLEFSEAARKSSIQHIIGCNLKILFNETETNKIFDQITLYAKDEVGYKNLLKLVSYSIVNTTNSPLSYITLDDLKKYSKGLILLTGSIYGTIGRLLFEKKDKEAENSLIILKDIFDDRLYIEITRLGYEREAEIEEPQLELAYKHNIPIVATNEVFFATPEMHEAHDALLCIAEGRYLVENDRRKVSPNCYFKSSEEMKELFSDLPEAILNTSVIAKRCSYMCQTRPPMLPSMGVNEEEELRTQSIEGLNERLKNFDGDKTPYFERLEYELEVIINMKFPGYFLIVSDFIKWSKKNNIPVGPGRGSGAGSIIAWSLYITDLDPIKFGLIFERFLNPERVSMPDFDIDFCQERRDEVISYVQQKYGYEKVAQIITFGKLQARAVIRDVGRVMQLPYSLVDKISKLVPFNAINPVTLSQAIAMEPMLQKMQKEDEQIEKLLSIALKLEGLNRHCSTHAAGLVIADRPLIEVVPLYSDTKSSTLVIQYSMKYAEMVGLVKFDFLGLKTLTVIANTCNNIRERGIDIDINKIDINDNKTYQLLSRGDAIGVFQFESVGMRDSLRKLKPDCIEDILALGALYRPGPMDNIPAYIAVKHGKQKPDYLHPKLEPILKETFGVIIYQEQVQKIAQVLAGYTLGAADLLRRAMGKKIKAEMDGQREIFVKGAIANGIEKDHASYIFDLVAKFAGYGFNKSHAAAYGIISYQTAYLKANYPLEFFTSQLNLEINDTDKILLFQQDARNSGINILPPDINKSDAFFKIEGNSIRFGLAALKNVGLSAMKELCNERNNSGNYTSIFEIFEKCNSKITNKRQIESLIKSGAFDSVHSCRKQLFDSVDILLNYGSRRQDNTNKNQINLFGENNISRPTLIETGEWQRREKLNYEFESFGFYLNEHPLGDYIDYIKSANIRDSDYLKNKLEFGNSAVTLAGIILSTKTKLSPKGKYVSANVSDMAGTYEISVFDSKLLEQASELFTSNTPVLIKADARKDEGGVRLVVRSISKIDDNLGNSYSYMKLWLKESASSIEYINNFCSGLLSGKTKLKINIITEDNHEVEIELPKLFNISIADKLEIENHKEILKVELV